ncbi:MAG TPA: GNAT family N-acetyltransferase [Nocardioides sp.]|uniref:GNAT family N-acetyltransferase n=1 Tax=uncultured Nocardioides sp. TaxID=198441 RepID=UPI0026348EB4|nr:GNAT family N-acetyltransferase [uncultured Nocardioides sp.]HRD61238.1 GNAT family N-acetyltransferase [Nocardioides sp.]HRI97668.1 GNAT family N-acetyltransferase [Nocardioides sp.]HRK47153.1 GNAT family N-acetyltransferase [Nocardioides sp.]
MTIDGESIRTPRLVLRPWSIEDAPQALRIFGDESVTRWLSPAMTRVSTQESMAQLIESWLEAPPLGPAGRWAVTRAADDRLLGGVAVLPLPPGRADLEVGWQLDPAAWGLGYAAEAGHAVAHHAFEAGADELFAVVRPRNTRGARTATSIGMEWVGETEKYYDLRLQVYRLRKGELDAPRLPGA